MCDLGPNLKTKFISLKFSCPLLFLSRTMEAFSMWLAGKGNCISNPLSLMPFSLELVISHYSIKTRLA